MGLGGLIFCEWKSVAKEYPDFQRSWGELEQRITEKCRNDWSPRNMGFLVTHENEFGRTSILPRLFLGWASQTLPTWRQGMGIAGNQLILQGVNAGMTIPEDIKIAWIGLAFPNKQQQISEIKFQIGDRKYGRINIEEMLGYHTPAIIFEEGFIIDEEQDFDMYAYIKEPDYQRVVMLGAAYYKFVDKVLGVPGAVI